MDNDTVIMWAINMQIVLCILTEGVDRGCRVCAGHLPCLGKAHSCQEIQDFVNMTDIPKMPW